MGITAGYRAFSDPESVARDLSGDDRIALYAQGWLYYRSMQFSTRNGYDWSTYLHTRGLYKHTRLIYNPVPMIVDFYVDNIWQPANNPDIEQLVTPVSDKTDEDQINAIAQLDQWGGWLSESQKIKRYAGATGNVLIEGIDDLTRQKILHKTIWPGYVTDLELNATGDVLSYTLEYDVYDRAAKQNYRYKKIVDKERFRYFRDDRPYAPEGKSGPEEPNPYGFCFAVWVRHTDDGGDFGGPACYSYDKVDNVNSLASHLDDNIHKAIESPKVIGAEGELVPIIGAVQNEKTKAITPQDPRLNWVVFKASGNVTVADLAGSLRLAEAHPYLKEQLASFHDDYPELQASTIIKENSQLSGAALERMLGPAQNRLNGVQANYNAQLVKLRQMQMAVGGMRSNGGGWSNLTDAQRAFKPYGLRSFEQGDLNFYLKPSVLIQSTEEENEAVLKLKADRAVVMQPLTDREEALKIAGYSEDQIKDIVTRAPEQPTVPPVIPAGIPEERQLPA